MQQFDVVLKVLLRSSLERITGNRIVRWLPTELPKVQNLRVDLLGETAGGELVQIEVQSTNDERIPFRMLEYLALIIRAHQRIPKQILLYVGREPLRMQSHFTWADGSIRYKIVDMYAVDGAPFLTSPEPGDNVLAILTRLQDSRAAVRSILQNISKLPREEAKGYYQALLILAGLRGLAKAVQEETQRMLTIDLSENEVLGPPYLLGREDGRQEGRQQGLAEGLREGRQEGRHEGQLMLLRRQIEQRFGALPAWAEQKLGECSTQDLEAIALRVLNAASLDDLFR